MLRALSLAKYLPENGVRVDVLTARNAPAVGKDTALLRQVPESVTVHRTWTLDLPFWLRKAVKKVISGGVGKTTASPQTAVKGANPLKQFIGNLLLPDPQVGWLPFALPEDRCGANYSSPVFVGAAGDAAAKGICSFAHCG